MHNCVLLFLSGTGTADSTLDAWRGADAVCFDVDSTVIVDEGLDQLAAFCGKGAIVREM